MKSRSQIRAGRSRFPDQFDRIPDPLILIIFNKLADARSLGRCAAVSRRFRSIVPLVDDVYVKIGRVVTVDGDSCRSLTFSFPRPRKCFSHFLKLMLFAILRPIRSLHNPHCGGKRFLPPESHRSPAQVLKNFRHLRRLRIELPAGDVRTEDGVLLRWRAEFGSTLESCVILGGTRTDRLPPSSGRAGQAEDDGSMPESFYTNGGLKLRVVWAIGTLIAASTRHYLLQEIIEDHPTLESLVLTDADGQGTLSMGIEQLKEFREKPLVASASSTRTHLPASSMKLRYAPYLELPEGMAMQGATLVAISPATDDTDGNSSREECDSFIRGAFEGPLGAAVKSLAERRIYLMEINGF
ncbi:F-box protein [Musa troglodytarum]|uniref:F-box protein n=1 Tax=Musa troglodytarum TaxID=320322 RepID=A0A9E7GEU7_9LILI|nr:F-box protein [Musa troglodytarum]URE13389.1 F-box protein [Musa troglodytarum]URE13390.1 F-box protein [Musa troglodytarum]